MKSFLLIMLLAWGHHAFTQDWLVGSSSNFINEAFDVKKDSQGNSIITGYFSGQTNFQGTILQSQSGYSDIYVMKLNSTGNVIWAKSFGGNQADRGMKLAIDNAGNIYVTGYFFGTMTMGATTLTSNNNSRDFFLAKLDPSGNVLWARSDGGSMGETAYDVALDSQNNCIVTGQFEGTTQIGSTSSVSQWNPIDNVPSFDIFIAKYSASGTPMWAKNGMSEYEDRGIAVTCDASDNIYVTGQFSDTLVFLGQTVNNQIYNAGFVAKISPAGNPLWFRKLAAGQTLAYDIELNNAGEVYITGDFLGTMSFWDNAGLHQIPNPYSKKIFAMKLTNAGEYIWGKAHGSDSEVSSRALLIDAAQNIYIGGYFKCNFDEYRDSTSTGLWTSVGFRDIFVTKLAPSGSVIWKKHAGGKKDDICYALADGSNDKPIFAGSFVNHLIVPTASFSLANYTMNGQTQYASDGFDFYNVQGDESKNSFVGKAIGSSTPLLFYYIQTPYDSIMPDLLPATDTIEDCASFYLQFSPKTRTYSGPGYNVSWSNGTTAGSYLVTESHPQTTVYMDAQRWDGCSSFRDSIYVIPRPLPDVPRLTDDHGFNTNKAYSYNIIKLCAPDTAMVSYSNLCTNCTITTQAPNGTIYNGTGPFPVWLGGNYYLTVTNEWGCTSTVHFQVQVFSNPTPAPIELGIVFATSNMSDTVTVCDGEPVYMIAIDWLTNPSGDYDSYNHAFFDEAYSCASPQNSNCINAGASYDHQGAFTASTTGWYFIRYDTWLGTSNLCGTDTVHHYVVDSVYVIVNPGPSIAMPTLTSDGPLCPGEFIYVSTSTTYTDFSWTGPAITWMSADQDSIQLTEPGMYAYFGYYNDPVTGCNNSVVAYVTITEKSPPPIIMEPLDGIVCPFDSVHLVISTPGTYDWIGPEGYSIGTGADVYVTEQGLYHCVYTDPDGCTLTTQQVEVREYTSPYLQFLPGNNLCISGEVELTAIYDGNAVVQWQAPLGGTGNSVTVTNPGTYYCEITQCGITVVDSVVITSSTFTAPLIASDTILCYGEQITLSTIPGMAVYEWLDGAGSGSAITISSPGTYQVTVTSSDGCTSISPSVTITAIEGSMPPPINDVQICPGANVTLTDNSAYTTVWYSDTSATAPDHTGNTVSFTNVTSDTVIYAAYVNAYCPLAFEPVVINVNETLQPPAIIGSFSLCAGVPLQLGTDTISGVQYNWTYNGNTISTSTMCTVDESQFISGEMIHLTITNLCSSVSDSAEIILVPQDTLHLNIDSLIVCPGTEHQFFPDPAFAGEIHWQNGTNSYTGNPLTLNTAVVDGPLLIAYGVNRNGCISVADTVWLEIPAITYSVIETSGSLCFGTEVILHGENEAPFVWITPAGDSIAETNLVIPVLDNTTAGLYQLYAADPLSGCTLTDAVWLSPFALPVFDIQDTILCMENLLTIDPPSHSDWSFYWHHPDSLLSISPDTSGIFLLTATDVYGCSYTDSVEVTFVNCNPEAFNVITANNDGINDYFMIPNSQYMYGNYLIIFNRWGNIVFETADYRNEFNGGDLTEGVYFYRFFPKGKDKAEMAIEGFFHIVR